MLFLLGLILPLVAFIFESYPRFLNPKFGVDIWTHLLYLKAYHKQQGIPKFITDGFLVPGSYDYPPIFILILSRFPFRLVEKYEFLFSPFFDMLHLYLIFVLSYLISGSIFIALLTQLLYILTPIIILENSSATPRSLGYTLFSILMMSFIFFSQTSNIIWLLPALASGSLIFLTHRFTTQGFLLFAIILSVIEENILFISIFVICFFLATILSKGFYRKVLFGHLGNLRFWKNNIKYRFAHQVKGNLTPSNTRDFVFRVYTQFLKFPPFVLQITNPWIIISLYLFVFEQPQTFILSRLLIWVIISYILAIMTMWIPKLRFLGEGQRYLELSAFPTAFLASNFLFSKMSSPVSLAFVAFYFLVGFAAFITIVVIQRKAIIKERLRTVTPEMKKMFIYLKSLKTKPNLLCIPHQITTNVIYHTGCPVFVNADYATINKISDVYPYIRKPVKKIMNEHQLDLILLNQDYSAISDLKLKSYKVIKKIGNFVLLKVL